MDSNQNRVQKPNRSIKPATAKGAKDPQKAIAEIKKRSTTRQKKQQQQKQLIILGAALLAVIVAIVIIAVACSGGKGGTTDVTADASPAATAPVQGTDTDLVPVATEPTGTNPLSVNGLGEVYTAEEYLQSLTPGATPQPVQYLPVIEKGPTDSKRIAITVDDLNEVDNLNKIITIAESNKAKITLFAIGSVVDAKPALQEALRRADKLSFEIENHTYDHEREKRVYSLDDAGLAYEIYQTQLAVNNALGVNYDMHFVRLPGGNGETDLRTHQYLIQLGNYKGVAHWTFSGSNASITDIKKSLKPGYIYLFHCKDADLKKLEEIIPYAVEQGFELVTLNEMLGYEPNAKSSLTGDSAIPEPYPFVYQEFTMVGKKHYTQMYIVQLMQKRLIDLGYLSSAAAVDGDYGDDTKLAVRLFQYYNSLSADGLAGTATQSVLFSSGAKFNPSTYVAGDESTYPSGTELEMFLNSAG